MPLEIGLGRPNLVGIAQDHEHEPFAMRLDADQVLAPIHDELADGDLAVCFMASRMTV